MFSAIKYENGVLRLLDQKELPLKETWLSYRDVESVAIAIETMVVRGAPAIGCTAAFGLVLDAIASTAKTWAEYQPHFDKAYARLAATRPTAVNLFFALQEMQKRARSLPGNSPMDDVRQALAQEAQRLYQSDLNTCLAIGQHGLSLIKGEQKLRILTHCNTGSLATAGYGTALGVIRSLHNAGKLEHVFVDETRPYMQGARLTAYELKTEGIPFSLNADSAAAYLMESRKIDWVIVGADRIAANGDTANKIGTFSLAILARYFGVAFYVAAPLSTFDIKIRSGQDIPVEMRHARELTHFGERQVTPTDIEVVNPSFDVTPAELITGIITEHGVLRAPYHDQIARLFAGS